jgi:hypothetical protein
MARMTPPHRTRCVRLKHVCMCVCWVGVCTCMYVRVCVCAFSLTSVSYLEVDDGANDATAPHEVCTCGVRMCVYLLGRGVSVG